MNMKNIKRIITVCLGLCLVTTSLSGCKSKVSEEVDDTGKLNVVTTIFPYYDFVRQIAGDKVNLKMIVPAGMDTHSFEPTATDMINMGKADVLIYNGGEMESWMPKVIDAASNSKMISEAMMDNVDTVVEEIVDGMEEEDEHEHSESHEDSDEHEDLDEHEHFDENQHNSDTLKEHNDDTEEEPEYDEHIWTSPDNACRIVKRIAEILGDADKENAKFYKENADKYIKKLEAVDKEFEDIVDKSSCHYLVFGDRFPLRYFVDEYDLDYSAAFAGCSSDTEPSADTVAFLIDKVKQEKVPVVLKIELTSPKVADSIAEATGTKVETFYTCHNVTKDEFDKGVTYLDLMKKNVGVLKDALGSK